MMTSHKISDRDEEAEMLIISFIYKSTFEIVFRNCTLVKRYPYIVNTSHLIPMFLV